MSERSFVRFEPAALHRLGDDELDALPFGVIALGEAGRIARYNLAEARFARLDRAAVLGRSFFGEIARCTATPEFQGRYEELLSAAKAQVVRFDYLFAFRFGAQKVEVDMGNVEGAALVYLCINRRRFLPRQREVSESIEAPLIAELEPEAQRAGVTRDARARRHLELDVTFFDALLREVGELAGSAEALRRVGHRWGRYATVDLETEALEGSARTMADLTMSDAMDAVARFVERQRIGRLSFDYSEADLGYFSMSLERNVFAEVLSHPGCALLEGLFGAIFSHLAGRPMTVRETSCQATSSSPCSFVCVASSRSDILARALDGQSRSPREVAQAMARLALGE